jgi:hypothetical protein
VPSFFMYPSGRSAIAEHQEPQRRDRRRAPPTTLSRNCAARAPWSHYPDAQHNVAWLLEQLAERDARIAEYSRGSRARQFIRDLVFELRQEKLFDTGVPGHANCNRPTLILKFHGEGDAGTTEAFECDPFRDGDGERHGLHRIVRASGGEPQTVAVGQLFSREASVEHALDETVKPLSLFRREHRKIARERRRHRRPPRTEERWVPGEPTGRSVSLFRRVGGVTDAERRHDIR